MSQKSQEELESFFSEAYGMIYQVRHTPHLLHRLQRYGYDETCLEQGLTLHEKAVVLNRQQRRGNRKQEQLTRNVQSAWRVADEIFSLHRQFAQDLFKQDRQVYKQLELDQYKNHSLRGWIQQARQFYKNLFSNADALSAFSTGLDIRQCDLEQAAKIVQNVIDLKSKQEQEKFEIQLVKKERDRVVMQLHTFCRRLRLTKHASTVTSYNWWQHSV